MFVHATLTSANGQLVTDPDSGGLDQQGFPVKAYSVTVTEPKISRPQEGVPKVVSDPTDLFAKRIEKEIKEIYVTRSIEKIRLVRIVLDFDNDGFDDVALASSLYWGNAGAYWEVYIGNKARKFIFLDRLFFHPLAVSIQPIKKGKTRIVTYHRLGAHEGNLIEYNLSSTGINTVGIKRMSFGDDKSKANRKEMRDLFGHLHKASLAEFSLLPHYLEDKNCVWRRGYYSEEE